MSAIFPKWVNKLVPVVFAAKAGAPVIVILLFYFYGSDKNLAVGYKPEQPIPFSHKLHAGEMGMDCRYCHVNVERSPHATVPPAQICGNCHVKGRVKINSPKLALLRESFGIDENGSPVAEDKRTENYGKPIPWVRIHNTPDYAYFDHSVHIKANVGCVSCHGRIDEMEVVKQVEPLTMGWCLDCHDEPEKHVRPLHVAPTNMSWPANEAEKAEQEEFANRLKECREEFAKAARIQDPAAKAKAISELRSIKDLNIVNPPRECSACHR